MSNFEIKDNKIILTGLTASGESVFIEINIEDMIQTRNEYIKNNKEYVKSLMMNAFKILFS